MFPVAEKVTLYRLTDENGQGLGVFQKITNREALGNPNARQGKFVTKNETTGETTETFAFFVPASVA